jgi:hypothetical protein
MSDAPRNIPVPDELADIRAQMKALETREEELKALLIANPDVRQGANWLAEIKTVTQQHTDLKEMRAMHADLVAEYTFPRAITRVELSAIDADTGEIVSPQRKAAQRRRVVQDVVREWLKDNPGQDRFNMPPEEFKRRLAIKDQATESHLT